MHVPLTHILPSAHAGQQSPAGHTHEPSEQVRPSVHPGQHVNAGQTHTPSSQTRPSAHGTRHGVGPLSVRAPSRGSRFASTGSTAVSIPTKFASTLATPASIPSPPPALNAARSSEHPAPIAPNTAQTKRGSTPSGNEGRNDLTPPRSIASPAGSSRAPAGAHCRTVRTSAASTLAP